MRGQVLEKSLNGVIEKIAALLEGGAVESDRRASLQMALGVALMALGERESGTERLEQAVAAFNRDAQGVHPRTGAPRLGPWRKTISAPPLRS